MLKNPLAGDAAGADIKPLINYSLELGVSLTKKALATLGSSPAQLRSYTKAAVVGIDDAFNSTPVLIHDAPRPDEIVLWIGYAAGPRVNARSKGPDQKEIDALIASFNNG